MRHLRVWGCDAEFAIPSLEGSEALGDTLADATQSESNESDSGSAANDSVEEQQPAQRLYPVRDRRPPCPYSGTMVGEQAFDDIDFALTAYGDYVPESLSAAFRDPNADHWKAAAQSEIESLHKRKTWILVDKLPPGKNLVSNKWVFTHKRDGNAKIIRYKARVVARGSSQRQGIGYEKVFCCAVWIY